MARKSIKFPSISRIINDRDASFIILGATFILVSIIFVTINLKQNFEESRVQKKRHEKLLNERHFWEDKLSRLSDYRDGYLMLAKVNYEMGDKKSAAWAIEKALAIDPNYNISKNFQKILQGN